VTCSYPKALRLRTRRDYKSMSWQCTRQVGTLLIVDVRKNNTQNSRLGITVTRKFGDSHKRNRFKRIVREAFRLSYSSLAKGLDLNVRPRSAGANAKSQDVQAELMQLLNSYQ
jgi:ribonuclease P protein component